MNNDTKMKRRYDPTQPFEDLIDQIEEGVDFASAGKQPYSPKQIINIAYSLVFDTALFPEACREWRNKEEVQKTWANFKKHFQDAHLELRESGATLRTSGYHDSINRVGTQEQTESEYIMSTVEAINNVA